MVAVSVMMAAMAIIREEFSEKMDKVLLGGILGKNLIVKQYLTQHLMQNSDIRSLLLSPLERMLNLPF